MIAEKKDNRIHWVDLLKGIGILLVIFQHCIGLAGGVESNISVWILSFHMPLFFFASGFFTGNYGEYFWRNKVCSLMVPVLVFSIINIVLKIICSIVKFDVVYEFINFAGFWFVQSVFYIVIIHFFVNRYWMKNNVARLFLVMIVSITLGLGYASLIEGREVIIATTLVGYFFYLFGYVYIRYINNKIKINSIFKGAVGILAVVLGYYVSSFNIPVLMYSSTYGRKVIFVIAAILGCIGVAMISEAVDHCRTVEFLGRNSLIILFTHFPVHRCVMKILSYFSSSIMLNSIFGFIIVCLIEIPIVIFINRFFPILAGKIKVEK